MKTVREWIGNIEDPELKEKLFTNIVHEAVLNLPSTSLYNCLSNFSWQRSPEGTSYWATVAKRINLIERILKNGKENN